MSERTWPPADVALFDLGHGVSWTKSLDTEGNWIGILEWHQCGDTKEGHLSPGGVLFEGAPEKFQGARWKLESENPLTLSPSILCQRCGLHGFIRDGKWVPA